MHFSTTSILPIIPPTTAPLLNVLLIDLIFGSSEVVDVPSVPFVADEAASNSSSPITISHNSNNSFSNMFII